MAQQFRVRLSQHLPAKGFTLIELMMVLAVFSILLAVGVPAFRTMFANNQSVTLSEDFIAALNLARSEAVKRGKPVSICRTTDGAACAAAGGDWNTGFLVYVDEKTSETDADTGIASNGLIQVFPSLVTAKASISVKRNAADVIFLRYTSLGTLARTSNTDAIVNAGVTGCKGDNKRSMTIKLSGSISVSKQTCS